MRGLVVQGVGVMVVLELLRLMAAAVVVAVLK
jgi:hypothetical protein